MFDSPDPLHSLGREEVWVGDGICLKAGDRRVGRIPKEEWQMPDSRPKVGNSAANNNLYRLGHSDQPQGKHPFIPGYFIFILLEAIMAGFLFYFPLFIVGI